MSNTENTKNMTQYAWLNNLTDQDMSNGLQVRRLVLPPKPTDLIEDFALMGEDGGKFYPFAVIYGADCAEYRLGEINSHYAEFIEAQQKDIRVLNETFVITLEEEDDSMLEACGARVFACRIRGDEIIAQYNNYVLTNHGGIVWLNWLCLEPKSADRLRRYTKQNKYFKGTDWESGLRAYPFIADELGFVLDCRQYNSLEDLIAFAAEWNSES